jgi:hypothetical protein
MFVMWAGGALQTERKRNQPAQLLFFIAAGIATTLLIGLRFEVGGDWGAYQRMYDDIYFLSLPAAAGTTDPGYAAVNWLAIHTGTGIAFVNTVCAALFMGGVGRLAWRQPNPALAVLVAVPYLIIVVAMGYTRQAAAIGLICFAVADASEGRLLRIVILVGIAALFHKTAVLILPLLMVPVLRRNVIYGAIGLVVFLILFALVLRDNSDRMLTNYVQSDYDSQGALIRVAMNVIAAALFLAFRKRIVMPTFQKSYWMTCSILAFLSVPALGLASASAGIDRISLYLIPLQIVVYARLPQTLGTRGRALPSLVFGVMAYCFLVQFVWLNYADNAGYWLPYTSVLNRTNT